MTTGKSPLDIFLDCQLLIKKVRSTSMLSYLRLLIQDPQPAIDHYGAVSTFHDDNICETRPAIDHYSAVSTFHDDNICETRFSMLCDSCLELTTENCSQQ